MTQLQLGPLTGGELANFAPKIVRPLLDEIGGHPGAVLCVAEALGRSPAPDLTGVLRAAAGRFGVEQRMTDAEAYRGLLLRAAVFRQPVRADGITHDQGALDHLCAAELLVRSVNGYLMHRWVARLVLAGAASVQIRAEHEAAMRYWRDTGPSGLREVRHHQHEAGDLDGAVATTEEICDALMKSALWPPLTDRCRWALDLCVETFRWVDEAPGPAAILLRRVGQIEILRGHDDAAEQYLDKALLVLRRRGADSEIAATLRLLAEIAVRREDLDAAKELLGQALERSEQAGDDRGLAQILMAKGRLTDGPPGISALLRAADLYQRIEDHGAVATCLVEIAERYYDAGQLAEMDLAVRRSQAARRRDAEAGVPADPSWLMRLSRVVVLAENQRGRTEQALELARELIDTMRQSGDQRNLLLGYEMLAELLKGDERELGLLTEADEIAEDLGDWPAQVRLARRLAELHAAQGRYDEAVRLAVNAWTLARVGAGHDAATEAMMVLESLRDDVGPQAFADLVRQADPSRAAAIEAEAARFAAAFGGDRIHWPAAMRVGVSLMLRGYQRRLVPETRRKLLGGLEDRGWFPLALAGTAIAAILVVSALMRSWPPVGASLAFGAAVGALTGSTVLLTSRLAPHAQRALTWGRQLTNWSSYTVPLGVMVVGNVLYWVGLHPFPYGWTGYLYHATSHWPFFHSAKAHLEFWWNLCYVAVGFAGYLTVVLPSALARRRGYRLVGRDPFGLQEIREIPLSVARDTYHKNSETANKFQAALTKWARSLYRLQRTEDAAAAFYEVFSTFNPWADTNQTLTDNVRAHRETTIQAGLAVVGSSAADPLVDLAGRYVGRDPVWGPPTLALIRTWQADRSDDPVAAVRYLQDAADLLDQALITAPSRIEPLLAVVQLWLAVGLDQLGRYDEALQAVDDGLDRLLNWVEHYEQIARDLLTARRVRCVELAALGRSDEAARAYQELVDEIAQAEETFQEPIIVARGWADELRVCLDAPERPLT